MTAVALFDVLAGGNPPPNGTGSTPVTQLVELAAKLVASTLADHDRLLQYERDFALAETGDDSRDLQLLQTVWQLFSDWAADAEQVLARVMALRKAGIRVHDGERLNDLLGGVQARLKLTPERIVRARDQVRRGEFIPAKELRDELRARLRGRVKSLSGVSAVV